MLIRRAKVRSFCAGVTSAFDLCPSAAPYDATADALALLAESGISPPADQEEFFRLARRAATTVRLRTYKKVANDARLPDQVRSAAEAKVAAGADAAASPLVTVIPARPWSGRGTGR